MKSNGLPSVDGSRRPASRLGAPRPPLSRDGQPPPDLTPKDTKVWAPFSAAEVEGVGPSGQAGKPAGRRKIHLQ